MFYSIRYYNGVNDNKSFYKNFLSCKQPQPTFEIPNPWSAIHNCFLRLLCHIHLSPRINSMIQLPFKSIWWKKIFFANIIPKNESVIIIINAHFYSLLNKSIVKHLKKHFKQVYFVFEFSDKYSSFSEHYKKFPSVTSVLQTYDLVITYNYTDSLKNGFVLSRPCFEGFSPLPIDDSIPPSDVFFVGKNKNRLNLIHSIFTKCTEEGLKCDFYVIDVNKEEMISGITYNSFLPYEEVLKHVQKTKCVLNLSQIGGEGMTMRDYEALSNNKLLLTNNSFIKKTPFYNEDQVLFVDELDSKIDMIKTGFIGNRNYCDEYSLSKWYEWLESTILRLQNGKH